MKEIRSQAWKQIRPFFCTGVLKHTRDINGRGTNETPPLFVHISSAITKASLKVVIVNMCVGKKRDSQRQNPNELHL